MENTIKDWLKNYYKERKVTKSIKDPKKVIVYSKRYEKRRKEYLEYKQSRFEKYYKENLGRFGLLGY